MILTESLENMSSGFPSRPDTNRPKDNLTLHSQETK